MAIISINYTPDYDYSGTYTLKIYRQPVNNVVYTKNYNPPFSVPITENVTVSGVNEYIIKITANDCSKIVYEETVTPPTICGIPTNVKSNSIAQTSTVITWAAPTTGAPSNGYYYKLYVSGSDTVIDEGSTTTPSKSFSGLTPNVNYVVYIYALCGTNILGTPVNVTFKTAAYCGIPDAIAVTDITTTGAKITWSTPVTGGEPSNGYFYTVYQVDVEVQSGAIGGHSKTLTGLLSGVDYYVTLQVVCDSGIYGDITSISFETL